MAAPKSIDQYIATVPPEVQKVLQKIRLTIRRAAPQAQETISYRMPALKTGRGILLYFAAFKNHIGVYPPVRGDVRLVKSLARYAGEKGNLRFPLDQPIPYDLIEKMTRLRLRQCLAKTAADSAEKVLRFFERCCPTDHRPRQAIEAARGWARGTVTITEARAAAVAAHSAARQATDSAAVAAARAAGHAAATAHTAGHARAVATYAARASPKTAATKPESPTIKQRARRSPAP